VNPPASDLRAQPAETRDTLIALPRALEMLAAQIYGEGNDVVPRVRTDLFDGLASTLSVLAPMFVLESATSARRLSDADLHKALFRKGGSEMYFVDGRAPIDNLAVTAEGMAKVLRVLKGSASPD
jgi:hypothetical protein